MPVTVTLQQANRFTMARHGLLDRAWRDPVAAAGNLCGLHAQVPTTPPLSLWCRLADFDRITLDAALYRQRSLVKRWLMRGTLHLVPMRDLPIYHRALQRAWGKSWGRYLARRQRTTPAEREARLYPVALAALDDGSLSRQAWRDRVQAQLDPAGRDEDGFFADWSGYVKEMTYQGLVVYAEPQGVEVCFARADRWLPAEVLEAAGATGEEAARRELLLRYLATYGPATVQDAAYWSGLKVSEMRSVLHELEPHLVEVTVEGQRGRYWLCRQDVPALLDTGTAQPVPLRLLPRFDPLLLGHKDKRRILNPAHRSRVFRPAGEVTATLLVDGRVAASWRTARERQTLAIILRPFASLPVDVLDQCQREGTSLASFMGLQNVRLEVVEE